MKTVFKDGAYERVADEVGEIRTKNQGWKYVPKSEWKQNARVVKTEAQVVQDEKKEETVSKKALRRSKLKEKQRPADLGDKILA